MPVVMPSQLSLAELLSQWQPNLVEHGDIEPHPGPRVRGQQASQCSSFSLIWDLNVCAAPAAWEVLTRAASRDIPVVALQEVRMWDSEMRAFARPPDRCGYIVHHAVGTVSHVRGQGPRINGGEVVLVKRTVKHSHAWPGDSPLD